MSILTRARSFIASRHGGLLASRLARVAEQYLNAYDNIANWDIEANGELSAIRRIIAVIDGSIFDVGANTGQWATAVLPYLNGRSLHSFEPVPAIFQELMENIGSDRRVVLINSGLSSVTGAIAVHYSPSISTISSAYSLIHDQQDETLIQCRMINGDEYVESAAVDEIALLKIDVEGMEFDVLSGLKSSFENRKIKTVQFEHGPSHILSGHSMKDFADWFDRYDFKIYTVFPHTLVPYRYDITRERFAGQNFYAIRTDVLNILKL